MSDPAPLLQACPNCAGLLDVSDEEPFAQVHCPMCGTSMRARKQFNNFSILEPLGAGGMGSVYKALDVNLNRPVALKLLKKEFSANEEFIGKFETEARITASVNHPNVVKVFSFGSDHGIFYIAMELVDKGSLDDLMELQKRVAEIQVLQVGIQVAQGLHAAFQKGLIHRDVKPGNILFADAQTAKIVDFGLALLMEQEAEARGEIWGTPYYVAPEKLNHEPEDFRSDIYSLGGTLFHAVAGRPPFEAENASLVALKHLKSQAVSLQAFAPDVSSATAYVINRALNKDPEKRYQSYTELIDHLKYARSQLEDATSKPRVAKQRIVLESEHHKKLMGLLTIGLILLVFAVGVLLYMFRERFFGAPVASTEGGASTLQAPVAAGVAGEQYQLGRQALIGGDFPAAEVAFSRALAEPNVPQPLLNWIRFHQGLVLLLNKKVTESRAVYQKIYDAGSYSTAEGERALAAFFVEGAGRMATDEAVPPVVSRGIDKSTVQAFALLLYGAKNWDFGRFEDAAPLLAEFGLAKPEEAFEWIAEYKPLAKKFLRDFDAYKRLVDQLAQPEIASDATTKIKMIDTFKSELQVGGRIIDKVAALEGGSREAVEAAQAEKKRQDELAEEGRKREAEAETKLAETEAKELKTLDEVIEKIPSLYSVYKYDQAVALLAKVSATTPKAVEKKERVLRSAQSLARFRRTLINDINTVGFPAPLTKKTGVAVAGQARKASETQIEMHTPYGVIPVGWLDIAPKSIITMADHFRKLPANAATAADRLWMSGIFALTNGLGKEGRAMLAQAAQVKPEYAKRLSEFPE